MTIDFTNSIFGDWQLHTGEVPYYGQMAIANHVRACLDLIEQGNFGTVEGMRNNFIDNDKYNSLIFSKVIQLKNSPIWTKIDAFMGKEYLCQWLDFKEKSTINENI